MIFGIFTKHPQVKFVVAESPNVQFKMFPTVVEKKTARRVYLSKEEINK